MKKISEKRVGFRKALPNLKVPVNRKQGKIYNPKTKKFEEVDEETTTTASIPNPAQTAMGPTGKGMVSYVHDRRRRKKDQAVMVKRFKKYFEDKGVY